MLGQTLQDAMVQAGHDTTWYQNAQKALDSLDDQLPDAIVLEIQLGTHNGIELLYEIRSYPEWQGIPVIVHTINNKALEPVFSVAFAELGVEAVLYKPRTTIRQLIKTIDQTVSV